MTAAESAEAILIVIKRLAKWALAFVVAMVLLGVLLWLGKYAIDWYEARPYAATKYLGVSLGDSRDEVYYALGQPKDVLAVDDSKQDGPWKDYRLVVPVKDIPTPKTPKDYAEWVYAPSDATRWDIDFAPDGKVRGIGCYSAGSYDCPALYGVRDGATEDDVRAQLGPPAREELDGVTKRMRYPAFNVTVFLEKRRVYRLRLSRGATP